MSEQQPALTKQAFLEQAACLGLRGDDERMDALFEETKRTLARAKAVDAIDTVGVAPSPINPQFEAGA